MDKEDVLKPSAEMTLFNAPEMFMRRVVTAWASALTLSCLSWIALPTSESWLLTTCTCFVAAVMASTREEMAD